MVFQVCLWKKQLALMCSQKRVRIFACSFMATMEDHVSWLLFLLISVSPLFDAFQPVCAIGWGNRSPQKWSSVPEPLVSSAVHCCDNKSGGKKTLTSTRWVFSLVMERVKLYLTVAHGINLEWPDLFQFCPQGKLLVGLGGERGRKACEMVKDRTWFLCSF